MVNFMMQYMDLILKFANIVIIGYAAYRFTKRPHDSLQERMTALEGRTEKLENGVEIRHKDFEQKLRQGNDRFRSISNVLEVLLTCTLALINFEVHYCESERKEISEDLEDARKILNKMLAKIKSEESI